MMNARDFVEQELAAILRRPESHPGGGYEYTDNIVSLAAALEPQPRAVLRTILLERVDSENGWGVALAALAEAFGPGVCDELAELLLTSNRSSGWREQVLLTLLQLGHAPIKPYAVQFLKRDVNGDRFRLLPLAGALAKIDPLASQEILTDCLIPIADANDLERVIGYLPGMATYLGNGDQLVQLVEGIRRADPGTAREFAALLEDYCRKPWVVKKLGEQEAIHLSKRLTEAAA